MAAAIATTGVYSVLLVEPLTGVGHQLDHLLVTDLVRQHLIVHVVVGSGAVDGGHRVQQADQGVGALGERGLAGTGGQMQELVGGVKHEALNEPDVPPRLGVGHQLRVGQASFELVTEGDLVCHGVILVSSQ